MGASLDDILTTQKNGVQAINAYVNATNTLAGTNNSLDISVSTIVKTSSGWLARIIVTTAGSTTGAVYDSNSTSSLTGTIFIIPNTVGITVLQFPFSKGLTIVPGTGMVLSVSYT